MHHAHISMLKIHQLFPRGICSSSTVVMLRRVNKFLSCDAKYFQITGKDTFILHVQFVFIYVTHIVWHNRDSLIVSATLLTAEFLHL